MRLETTQQKPTLLMLSDRFPDPDGDQRATRAWRLLCCASVTHRVYLSAVADKPVNLSLWRRVAKRVDRVQIAAPKRPWKEASPFSGDVITWTNTQNFDALLATNPSAWPAVFPGRISTAICDFTFDKTDSKPTIAGLYQRLWPRKQVELTAARRSQIIAACDRALVATTEQAKALIGAGGKVFILPDETVSKAWSLLFAGAQIPVEAPTPTVLHVKPTTLRHAA